ncbi:MAG: alpha/beta hydrolase [Azovibrio sp.]
MSGMCSMVRKFLLTTIVASLVLLGGCRSMIYHPTPKQDDRNSPENTFMLEVPDASVAVSIRRHEGPKALIYFGGNAEDVSYRLPGFAKRFPDHAIYLMNYRGYGHSSGNPSEEALHADAQALFDKVHTEHPNITVVGRSLGSGVAVHLASVRPVERLVLITPYDSIENVAAAMFPYLPVRWFIQDKFQSWRYAASVTAPTEILVAEHDEVIPYESTEALYKAFPAGVATMKVIPGTTHNSSIYPD